MYLFAWIVAGFSIVWTAILRFVDRCGLYFDAAVLSYRRKAASRGHRALPTLATNGPGGWSERE
ncbi:hypothetical protein [Streptomyces chartreusis]|uniref:hypothetical protein n=1 Tax=Streptomyces chartreusis TaxID=1969 RepID=UPI0036AC160B